MLFGWRSSSKINSSRRTKSENANIKFIEITLFKGTSADVFTSPLTPPPSPPPRWNCGFGFHSHTRQLSKTFRKRMINSTLYAMRIPMQEEKSGGGNKHHRIRS